MFIMNQCIICLEETNNMFVNNNCFCKYRVHQRCLNQWSRHCIICKAPIINKSTIILKWTTEWIIGPLLQIMFFPILLVYICFMNAVYLLNVYVLDSYDQLER
jgi:hypothetical protein